MVPILELMFELGVALALNEALPVRFTDVILKRDDLAVSKNRRIISLESSWL
jgi:hypothetical protein